MNREINWADRPIAVVAVGGHAFTRGIKPNTIAEYWEKASELADVLMTLVERQYNLVIAHGNGPQIGHLILQAETLRDQLPPMPIDVLVAETGGWLGYLLQQALLNQFRRNKISRYVVTMICQVLVDRQDPAFALPQKPVGHHMPDDVAERLQKELNWKMVKEKHGWRRVVPSPQPQRVVQKHMIRDAAIQGHVVIACGGGGIPIVKNAADDYEGIDAVIDKDLTASILASAIGAEVMIILTTVPQVSIHFGKPEQQELGAVTIDEVEQLVHEGHFPPGSMGPKVTAIQRFLKAGGRRGLITDAPHLEAALEGRAGTHFVGRL